ncbi:MAG: RnfABCDGE type electron transport complex subunit G [Paludibacter sp.]|nr:RnfABCDGE type electron transport complex subunit G [Paludibacter sp.]MDD4428729.1 RnfABCDGE type electron transport complex subunit G [Paludibacter sp.]
MAKLESTFRNMVLVLTSITLVAAVALGSMYNLTKEPIEASKKAKQENAIMEVLPPDVSIKGTDTIAIEGMPEPFYVYQAYAGDEFVGVAVQTYSKNGFSGEIKVMVGFDAKGNIINYSVLEQKETPGLGTKMVDWFKTEKGNQDIRGLNGSKNNLNVSKNGGEVDAITAATISSNAFLEAVRYAYSAYSQNYDGLTGATSVEKEVAQTN